MYNVVAKAQNGQNSFVTINILIVYINILTWFTFI